MSLSAARWHVIAESNFAWESEALDWLRSNLPDRDSWHVWTNFEFIDDEGKVSEVDALVLSPAGLFLVEIKSRPGVLRGDAHSWTWTTDGRSNTYDNPVILANRKAKRLASLLRRQPAITKAKIRLPFVEPAIFLSSSSLSCQLEGLARTALDLDQEQAGRRKHQRIDLADLAFIVDELKVRPDVPGIAVGQVAAHPVQRFALPREVGLGDDVPTGSAEAHGRSSAASGRCSKSSPTWQRKRRHSRSIAGRSTRVAVSL